MSYPFPQSDEAIKPKRVRKTKGVKPAEPAQDHALVVMHDVFGASLSIDTEYLPMDNGPTVRFMGSSEPQSINAESLVDSLIDAQVSIDDRESTSIVDMIAAVRSGAGDVKAFINCYAARAKGRISDKSLPVRKSNLKGVLSYALESDSFADVVKAEKLSLQAAYALRAEMLKGAKEPESIDASDDAVDVDDIAVDAMDTLRQQITNAIHAAETAQRADIADDLREILERVVGATAA